MRVLIAIAVNNTEENGRFNYTRKTVEKLLDQNIYINHDLYLINNGSCKETELYLKSLPSEVNVIFNTENIGTARAINKAWLKRGKSQHAIKMDDDVIIMQKDWIEQMVEAIEREPKIGIIGLKRKDCTETPNNPNPDLLSELEMLPHEVGQRWIIVERAKHIIGTCQMYNSDLLDKIGYLYQPSLYGFDDVIASHRSHIAGFWNVFLPHIEIEHIDIGCSEYTHWKQRHAGEVMNQVNREVGEMIQGTRSIRVEFY